MKTTAFMLPLILVAATSFAQVGIGTTTPNASAALDVSANDKGLLVPHLTETQRNSINQPATGLLVYQTDGVAGFYYNNGTPAVPQWFNLTNYTLQQNINMNNKWLSPNGSNTGMYMTGSGTGIGTSSPDSRLTLQANFNQPSLSFRNPSGTTQWHWVMDNNGGLTLAQPAVANRLYLQPTGRVGLGTVGTYGLLTIKALPDISDMLSFQASTGANKWHVGLVGNESSLNIAETGVADARLFIEAGGNIGIGTADPTVKLEVAGDIKYSGNLNMGLQYYPYTTTIPGHYRSSYSATCPAGMQIVSGGGGHRDVNDAQTDIQINYNGPDPNNPTGAWRLSVNNTSGSSRAIRFYLMCAKVK